MKYVSLPCASALALAVSLGGCAAQGPSATATAAAAPAVDSTARRATLSCTLQTNCVNSLDGGALAYTGSPEQALARLEATLAALPEARIVRRDGLWLETIFTTRIGFRDQVDFLIDPQARRIDYRSRSLLGLYDFGKNRSRMQDFAVRFEQQAAR